LLKVLLIKLLRKSSMTGIAVYAYCDRSLAAHEVVRQQDPQAYGRRVAMLGDADEGVRP